VNPSPDDVLSEPVLRSHPGRRHEMPQGVERKWSPGIQYLSRVILKNALGREGYSVLPLTAEKLTSQPLKDYLYPRPYTPPLSRLISRYTRPEAISDALEGLLYSSVSEDKFQPTLGTLHTPQTIALDVAPQIRNILRTENQRQRQPRQVLLENLWTNVRKTRGKVKEEQEGKTRYFDARVIDHDVVLKTWMDIPEASEMMDEDNLAVE
jgi:hypothetical protein